MERQKIIPVLVLMIMIASGCSLLEPPIKKDIQKVYIAVPVVPEVQKPSRPELPIDQMTPDQKSSDGEVAKHYAATVKALQGYIFELEEIVNEIIAARKQTEVIRKEIEEHNKEHH